MNKNAKKFLGIVAGLVLSASASAETVFVPYQDSNVNYLVTITTTSGTVLPSGWTIAAFDDSNPSFAGSNFLPFNLSSVTGDTMKFTPAGSDFTISNAAGNTATLTSTDQFLLALSTDGGSSWAAPSAITCANNNCTLGWAAGGGSVSYFADVNAISVPSQVPLPAPLALMVSGLVGLVGIGRRRSRMN